MGFPVNYLLEVSLLRTFVLTECKHSTGTTYSALFILMHSIEEVLRRVTNYVGYTKKFIDPYECIESLMLLCNKSFGYFSF